MLYTPTDTETHTSPRSGAHIKRPPEKQAVEPNLPCSHRKAPTCTRRHRQTCVQAQRPTHRGSHTARARRFGHVGCPSASHFVTEGSMGSLYQWSASQAIGPELPWVSLKPSLDHSAPQIIPWAELQLMLHHVPSLYWYHLPRSSDIISTGRGGSQDLTQPK